MIKIRLVSFIASTYIRFVGWTSRLVWVNRSVRDEIETGDKPCIYAFWHGRQVFLTYAHQNDQSHILISKSRDGEIIAQACESFGLHVIRGSSSRGAAEALLKMKELLESGHRVAITPDGPRGPLREVQPGAVYLAQTTGYPIIPIAVGAQKKWIIKSWDEYMVPKPFNRIAIMYGEPIFVAPEEDLDRKTVELKRALNFVAHEVDVISRGECSEEPVGLPTL